MPDYLLLMHDDLPPGRSEGGAAAWTAYLDGLAAAGVLRGGSAIGGGLCARKDRQARPITAHLNGFVRIEVADLEEATRRLAGNPVFEAGGTVEIRELPRTD